MYVYDAHFIHVFYCLILILLMALKRLPKNVRHDIEIFGNAMGLLFLFFTDEMKMYRWNEC